MTGSARQGPWEGRRRPRLAIVGSRDFTDPAAWHQAEVLAARAIQWLDPELVITGGAFGVDELAVRVASWSGRSVDSGAVRVLAPTNPSWGAPGGYRARNAKIVSQCTHLLALRCPDSKTYGSGWTHDLALAQYGPQRVWLRMLPLPPDEVRRLKLGQRVA